ncbi:hypothetical protein CDD83_326 [Cordyceps sp. RAO-2017]|nr:hypothetical protein CDD83_326 [Cordyceps sp. RAO-2017]
MPEAGEKKPEAGEKKPEAGEKKPEVGGTEKGGTEDSHGNSEGSRDSKTSDATVGPNSDRILQGGGDSNKKNDTEDGHGNSKGGSGPNTSDATGDAAAAMPEAGEKKPEVGGTEDSHGSSEGSRDSKTSDATVGPNSDRILQGSGDSNKKNDTEDDHGNSEGGSGPNTSDATGDAAAAMSEAGEKKPEAGGTDVSGKPAAISCPTKGSKVSATNDEDGGKSTSPKDGKKAEPSGPPAQDDGASGANPGAKDDKSEEVYDKGSEGKKAGEDPQHESGSQDNTQHDASAKPEKNETDGDAAKNVHSGTGGAKPATKDNP